MRANAKQLLAILATTTALFLCALPLLAYKANPSGGSRRGSDFNITVIDTSPDSAIAHELVTGNGFNFSQMSSNSTLSAWFDTTGTEDANGTAPGDTARVHLTGIGTDSAYVDTSFKVGAGDTVATARTFFMFEAAWVDTAVNSPIKVWTTTGSVTTTLLDSIPRGTLDQPMAHRLFGKQHNPLLKSVALGHQGALDTLHYEIRYFPNLANYRFLTSRALSGSQTTRQPYQVLGSVKVDASNPYVVLMVDKVLDPYSAIGAFAREKTVPAGVTAAVTFIGEYR